MPKEPKITPSEALTVAQSLEADLVPRLRFAVESAGGQSKVARATAIPLRTLQNWVGGTRMPKASDLALIALACGVSLDWLLLGRTGADGSSTALGDVVDVPILRCVAGTGQRLDDVEATRGAMPVALALLDRFGVTETGRIRAVEVAGDAMAPTVPHGAWLLVDQADGRLLHSWGLFVFRRAGGGWELARLQHHQAGGTSIRSDNPSRGPVLLTAQDAAEIEILGRVRGVLAPSA